MRGEETVEDTQRPPQLAASPTTRAQRTTPLQPAPVWDSGWGKHTASGSRSISMSREEVRSWGSAVVFDL
jgi:hypothetical protein